MTDDLTASPGNRSVTLSWGAVTNYAGIGYQYCQSETTTTANGAADML